MSYSGLPEDTPTRSYSPPNLTKNVSPHFLVPMATGRYWCWYAHIIYQSNPHTSLYPMRYIMLPLHIPIWSYSPPNMTKKCVTPLYCRHGNGVGLVAGMPMLYIIRIRNISSIQRAIVTFPTIFLPGDIRFQIWWKNVEKTHSKILQVLRS